jgi:hypothetical protein
MLPEVAETGGGRQRLPNLRRGRGQKHLPTVSGSREPRATIKGRSEIVVALPLDLPRVQSHPHAERADLTPGRSVEINLGPERRRDGIARGRERGVHGVADPSRRSSRGSR